MRVQRRAVLAPSLFVGSTYGISQRVLPISELRGGGFPQPFGELLPGEAMLRIGLPVHIERELHEVRKRSSLARKPVLARRRPALNSVSNRHSAMKMENGSA